jgi:hypothetical protein
MMVSNKNAGRARRSWGQVMANMKVKGYFASILRGFVEVQNPTTIGRMTQRVSKLATINTSKETNK